MLTGHNFHMFLLTYYAQNYAGIIGQGLTEEDSIFTILLSVRFAIISLTVGWFQVTRN